MNPGKTTDDADARCRAGPARRHSAKPRSPNFVAAYIDVPRRRRLARQRGDEDEVAAAARDHALGASSRASTIGARRLTSSARSICSSENVLEPARSPGARRWRRATSTSAAPRRRAARSRPRSARSTRATRPPSSAASGSSTSARRAGEHEARAPRERARARSHARARRWRRSTRTAVRPTCMVSPGEHRHGRGEAVQELSPPTGPISPAAKKPAAGAPPARRPTVSASWSA